jgi:hypothetical protein
MSLLSAGRAPLFGVRFPRHGMGAGCVCEKGKTEKGRKVAMTNAEIVSEVNGLLQRALGLLETIENKLPAEEAHAEEVPAEEVPAEEVPAEEAPAEQESADEQDAPTPGAQMNAAGTTVHAAEAEAKVIVDQA